MVPNPPEPNRGAGRTPVALTIAGSDSGGGAGVAADLKAFAMCGVHGALALTAVTAQSTVGVSATFELPPAAVLAQVRAVTADLHVAAVKIGMLGGRATAEAVAQVLAELGPEVPVVVDPVLASTTGTPLLAPEALEVLVTEILPRATVVTPNRYEARALVAAAAAQGRVESGAEAGDAGELLAALLGLGPASVLLTGGHAPSPSDGREPVVDLFVESIRPRVVVELAGERREGGADHGSGCTHSALLAAELALGRTPLEAARRARALTGLAIAGGLRDVGAGVGPVDVLELDRLRVRELGRAT